MWFFIFVGAGILLLGGSTDIDKNLIAGCVTIGAGLVLAVLAAWMWNNDN